MQNSTQNQLQHHEDPGPLSAVINKSFQDKSNSLSQLQGERNNWQTVHRVAPTGIEKHRLSHRDHSGNHHLNRQSEELHQVAVMKVVCLFMWLSVCLASGKYLPQELAKTLLNLLQHYKIKDEDLYNGKHVFPTEPLEGKSETQMLYMGGILEAYEKLIGHMLRELPTQTPLLAISGDNANTSGPSTTGPSATDTRSNLMKILHKIKELKTYHYAKQVKLLHELQNLKNTEMDNIKVQSKALVELPWIYEHACSLAEDVMRKRMRRRRRQTKTKTNSHLKP